MRNVFFLLLFAASLAGQTPIDSMVVVYQMDSFLKVSQRFLQQGEYDNAHACVTEAEKIAISRFGKASEVYAKCCLNRGGIYQQKGELADAEKSYLEAKSILEKALGKESFGYAKCLSQLGIFYVETGETFDRELEPIFSESIAIIEKVFGKAHPEYAYKLMNLALLYMNYGKYTTSEQLFAEVKAICDTNFKANNPEFYRDYIFNSALLYGYMGDFEKSILTMLEAKAFIEKINGKDHYLYANILNNLGATYYAINDCKTAEPLLFEAKEVYEKTLGKRHPKYAETIESLAAVYFENGNYEKAELFYKQAIAIAEKTLGKESDLYALIVGNLGNYYLNRREFDKSEPLLLETIDIYEKTLGREHPDCALYIRSLASLLIFKGDFDRAETLLLESAANIQKAHGKRHLLYAESIDALAKFYSATNRGDQAEPLYLESKIILEVILGKETLKYATCLGNLSEFYWRMGKTSAAASLQQEMAAVHRSLLVKASKYLSEQEMRSYALIFETALDQTLSFAQTVAAPGSTASSFDNLLFHKGFLLQSSSQVKERSATDSTGAERIARLRSCHRRLAAAYTLPFTERDSVYVADLEEKANELEKEIARQVAGYGDALRQVSWKEVQSALKPNEAALEFIRYDFYTPNPTDSVMYAALLLKPGMESPIFIPLFEEKQLLAILAPLAGQGSDGLNDLYAGQSGQSLYELLWLPLEPSLRGVKTVFIAPAGLLHRINLNAIPTRLTSTETIGKRYELSIVGSTRQLVIKNSPNVTITPAEAVIFGGIQYEIDSTAIAPTQSEELNNRNRGLTFGEADSTLRGDTWRYLKYSEKEVINVQTQLQKAGFQVEMRKGMAATEESFKTIGRDKTSPKILHLSTHGFFFPDVKNQARTGSLGSDEPVFKISDNPMIRAGLILAGGNYAWKNGQPLGDREDGILTAYEISQMDLRNTDLVVLSACETGLGQIEGNEGVYGLQRAFKIAGAKHLVMSLWQIPDFHTQELMTAFYNHMMTKKMPVREALSAAQEEMRLKRYEPFYWAGFVLVE